MSTIFTSFSPIGAKIASPVKIGYYNQTISFGPVAHLVERVIRIDEVRSSSLLGSTQSEPPKGGFRFEVDPSNQTALIAEETRKGFRYL